MTDDRGVLGNLPRSRPGQRSEKREPQTTAKTSAKAATRAERGGSKAASAAPGSKPRTPARPKPAEPAQTGGDPVGNAIRGAAGLAITGARVARAVLRRLPRP